MGHVRPDANTAIVAIMLLLSPIMLIFCLPLALGSGFDIFAVGGGRPRWRSRCAFRRSSC